MTWTITAEVSLKFAIVSSCSLTADVDQHHAPSSLTLGRIRERHGALLFVRRKESAANSFAADRKRNSSLLSFSCFDRFVILLLSFCRFVLF